jgi:hypothetical protein
MADEEKVALLIEALLSNESVKKFVDDAKKAGEDAAKGLGDGSKKGGGEPFKEQSAALGDLKGQITGMITQYIALSAAISYVGDSFHKALQEQKTNSQIIGNMQALTSATLEQAEATVKMLDAAELASGIDKDRLAPALNELAASTENLEQAQEGVRISAGAAARGLGTLEGNARILAMALETGVIPKKQAFGKVLLNLKEKTGSLDGAIKELNTRYGDAGQAVDTAAMQVERSKIQWDNAKEAIGGMVQGIVMTLMPALKWVAMAIAGVVGVLKLLGSGFMAEMKAIKLFGEVATMVFTGQFAEAGKHAQKGMEEIKDSFMADLEAVGDSIDAVSNSFDKMTGKMGGAAADKFKPGHGKKEKGDDDKVKVNLGSADMGIENGKSWADEELKKNEAVLESKRIMMEYMSKSEEDYNKELLKILDARILLYADNDDERYKLLLQKKQLEKKMEDDADKAKAKAIISADSAIKNKDIARLKELKAGYAADLKNFKGSIKEKEKLLKELGKVEAALAKASKKSNREGAADAINVAAGMFKENKELAIAAAIMNTYEGAARAFADYQFPMSAVIAALTVAGGLMQVKEIQSQDPSKGSGFDDPQNDLAAEIGGARWAKDFTKKFGSRAMKGMEDELGGGGGTTNNYHQYQPGQTVRTTNVNVGAVPLVDTGKDQMMRELASGIRTYINLDGERDVR